MDQITNTPSIPGETSLKSAWSWGAFMFDIPFLIAIKKYVWLLFYLLAFVPIVNAIFLIIFKIVMGMKGAALAAQSPQFTNQDEYNGFMRALDHAGKITFFGLIVVFVLIIGLVLFGFKTFIPYLQPKVPGFMTQ
ncbi:hypothetical protein HY967_01785 [Candidatus Jorgensenbacteria bacterium]|nr:hypothetical protein [Candidatus Jorgensenbacteria bacterium]